MVNCLNANFTDNTISCCVFVRFVFCVFTIAVIDETFRQLFT